MEAIPEMKGIIIFKESNKKSKSQGFFPYLETEDGRQIKIRMINENPFENSTLKEYEGKAVEVEGEITDTGTLIAESIREIEAEAPESDAQNNAPEGEGNAEGTESSAEASEDSE